MILTFLHIAARKGEVFRLTWQDVDFENARIRLWTQKRRGGNMEYDWLPLTKELFSALSWWRAQTPFPDQDYVFVSLDDTLFCDVYLGKPFKVRVQFMRHLCDKAGVKRFGFHAIRHLSASILYKQGCDVATIQRILRHRSPNTTAIYLRTLGSEDVRNALDDLPTTGRQDEIFLANRLKTQKPSGEPSTLQAAHAETPNLLLLLVVPRGIEPMSPP